MWKAVCLKDVDHYEGTFTKGKIYSPDDKGRILYDDGEFGGPSFLTFEKLKQFWYDHEFKLIETNDK